MNLLNMPNPRAEITPDLKPITDFRVPLSLQPGLQPGMQPTTASDAEIVETLEFMMEAKGKPRVERNRENDLYRIIDIIEGSFHERIELLFANLMDEHLQAKCPLKQRVINMVNRIICFCTKDRDTSDDVLVALMATWDVVLKLARRLTPYHEWQLWLLLTMSTLSERTVPFNEEWPKYNWYGLPGFATHIVEHWNRRLVAADTSDRFRLQEWKNINSFVARFSSTGFYQVVHLGIIEIREAFEKPDPRPADIFDCQVWVAAEWIVQIAPRLWWEMSRTSNTDDEIMWPTGDLLGPRVRPRGSQRWVFWKMRLSNLLVDARQIGLSPATVERMRQARTAMENQE